MAKVETVRLVDDISGDRADETVDFGLDGRRFEIDLSAAAAGRLRDELAPFLAVARPAGARGGSGPATGRVAGRAGGGTAAAPGTGAQAREQNRAVRVWAREHGFTVSERGRIPSEVLDAYRRGTPAGDATGPGGGSGTATTEVPGTGNTDAAGADAPGADARDTDAAGHGTSDADAPDGRAARKPRTRKGPAAPAVEFSG